MRLGRHPNSAKQAAYDPWSGYDVSMAGQVERALRKKPQAEETRGQEESRD